jgi:hypothetical protein
MGKARGRSCEHAVRNPDQRPEVGHLAGEIGDPGPPLLGHLPLQAAEAPVLAFAALLEFTCQLHEPVHDRGPGARLLGQSDVELGMDAVYHQSPEGQPVPVEGSGEEQRLLDGLVVCAS